MYKRVNELLGTEFKSDSEIDWSYLSSDHKLSESFIKEFKDKVDWYYISSNQILSETFIRKFKNEVFWEDISRFQNLSESFIKEFKDEIDWNWISSNQILSESFIREFQDKVDWKCISSNQILSWNFICEFEDKVDWHNIFLFQPFIDTNYKKINKNILEKNELYQLYQRTKNKGWFVGYVSNRKINNKYHYIMTYPFYRSYGTKSKIYWNNLLTIRKIIYFEPIRQIKLCTEE